MSRKTQRATAPAMNPQVLKNRVETSVRPGNSIKRQNGPAVSRNRASPTDRKLRLRASLDEARRLLAAQKTSAGPAIWRPTFAHLCPRRRKSSN